MEIIAVYAVYHSRSAQKVKLHKVDIAITCSYIHVLHATSNGLIIGTIIGEILYWSLIRLATPYRYYQQ